MASGAPGSGLVLADFASGIDEAERREQPWGEYRRWYCWWERVEVQALRREAEALLGH
jgi:hypothetical protein